MNIYEVKELRVTFSGPDYDRVSNSLTPEGLFRWPRDKYVVFYTICLLKAKYTTNIHNYIIPMLEMIVLK